MQHTTLMTNGQSIGHTRVDWTGFWTASTLKYTESVRSAIEKVNDPDWLKTHYESTGCNKRFDLCISLSLLLARIVRLTFILLTRKFPSDANDDQTISASKLACESPQFKLSL